MAVDEVREVFSVTPMHPNAERESDQVIQVWFPGEHACVGGGHKTTRGLSDAALEWMMDNVAALGLEVDKTRVEDGLAPDPAIPFASTARGLFKLTGIASRTIEDRFDNLHDTVRLRWREVESYEPPNLKPFESFLDQWKPSSEAK